jgi:hypothetical protein
MDASVEGTIMDVIEPMPLRDGENYVELLTSQRHWGAECAGHMFPAEVSEDSWNGWALPRFRREVAEKVAEWLTAMHPTDPDWFAPCHVEAETLVYYESGKPEGRVEVPPDDDGLYPLGAGFWCWYVTAPSIPDADAALLADHDRLVAQAGEVMVGLFLDDDDPVFPALVGQNRWNGWACPRFRREVAEVVAAWTNEHRRRDPEGSELAYWDGDDVVLVEALCNGGGVAERVEPDREGRYSIGGWRWTWSLLSIARPAVLGDLRGHPEPGGDAVVEIENE